jgi:hypothetical protein
MFKTNAKQPLLFFHTKLIFTNRKRGFQTFIAKTCLDDWIFASYAIEYFYTLNEM